MGWVYRFSPFTGATFSVHLAMADSVNDQNDNEFWMSQKRLGEKARVGRSATNEALRQLVKGSPDTPTVFVTDLGVIPNRRGIHRYRFEFPDVKVKYESRYVATDDMSATDLSATATGTCPQSRQVPVAVGNTEPKSDPKGEPKRGARGKVEVPFDFEPSPELRAWATARYPTITDLDEETASFVAHHRGKGNTFASVDAAWQKWIINANKFALRDNKAGQPDSGIDTYRGREVVYQ